MSEEKEKNIVDKTKDGITDYLKDKFNSPFWATFIVSWLLWNWKVWYVTFFIDSELLLKNKCTLKIDYISNLFIPTSFLDFIWILFHSLIFPYLSAYLIIFVFPIYITRKFYLQSLDNVNNEVLIKKRKEKELLDVEKDIKETKKDIKNIEKQSKTQQEIWNEEYEELKKKTYFNSIEKIIKCVFENGGYISDTSSRANILSIKDKTYFSTSKIIEIHPTSFGEEIKLTEKGNYFIKKFLDEKEFFENLEKNS